MRFTASALLAALLLGGAAAQAQVNLITNGDFADASDVTSYHTDYTLHTVGQGDAHESRYAIVADPSTLHSNWVGTGVMNPDPAQPARGNMFVANGAGNPDVVWAQSVDVMPNTPYQFNAWVASVLANDPAPANLIIQVDANRACDFANGFAANQFTQLDTIAATSTAGEWHTNSDARFRTSANASRICLRLTNAVTQQDGNDFALDDISLIYDSIAPVAVDDYVTMEVNRPEIDINVLGNDSAVSPATLPAAASTIDLDPDTPGIQDSYIIANVGTFSVNPDGSVRFVPVPTYVGLAEIIYTVTDSEGNVSGPAPIGVDVPRRVPPVAVDDSASTTVGQQVVIEVLSNDTATLPATIPAVSTSIDLDPNTPGVQDSFEVAGQGTFTVVGENVVFVPEGNYVGTVTATYIVFDSNGTPSENPATISVTITDATALPTAQPDRVFTTPGTVIESIDVLRNDSAVPPATLPAAASTIDLDPSTPGTQDSFEIPNVGTFSVNPDGTIRFEPAPGFVGSAILSYAVIDSAGAVSDPTTLTVIVAAPANAVPVPTLSGLGLGLLGFALAGVAAALRRRRA